MWVTGQHIKLSTEVFDCSQVTILVDISDHFVNKQLFEKFSVKLLLVKDQNKETLTEDLKKHASYNPLMFIAHKRPPHAALSFLLSMLTKLSID